MQHADSNIQEILYLQRNMIKKKKCIPKSADGIHCGFLMHVEQIIGSNSNTKCQHTEHNRKSSTVNTEIDAKTWKCRIYDAFGKY